MALLSTDFSRSREDRKQDSQLQSGNHLLMSDLEAGDRGRKYENRIEHRGRTAGDSWQHLVPTGNQRVAWKFYDRTNSMGGARRYCRVRRDWRFAVGESEKAT